MHIVIIDKQSLKINREISGEKMKFEMSPYFDETITNILFEFDTITFKLVTKKNYVFIKVHPKYVTNAHIPSMWKFNTNVVVNEFFKFYMSGRTEADDNILFDMIKGGVEKRNV